ncbi:hypothetical protein [Parasitella parasitica]|uniref:Uncharacterized protein n=1 Tax=Parasitella parasitica TaxID=35722 RepID=A0A0B7NIB3_9FUNG|nr:hypothetical protein [Parasitella parasitica]
MKLAKLSSLLLVPLALCATVPGAEKFDANTEAYLEAQFKKQAELITVLALQTEFVNFLGDSMNLANEVIAEESKKAGLENGPQNVGDLLELMFHKSSLYRAQVATNATAVDNPFQNLINGIGGAINGGINSIGGAINGVTGAVGSVLNGGKNATNATVTHTNGTNTSGSNPLGDLFGNIANGVGGVVNGVGGLVGNVTSGVTNGVGGLVGNVTGGISGALGNITTGVGGALGNLTHVITDNGLSNGLGGLIGSITNTTGNILGGLTNGIVNNDVLKSITSFAGTALGGLLNGSLSIGDIISNAIEQINKFAGGDNPLGKFIQSLAVYLSHNQDGLVANLIKTSTFINAVSNTVVSIAKAIVGNVTDGIKTAIFKAVSGIVGKIFGGGLFGLHRLQTMSSEEVETLQNIFVDAVRAQSPAGASYIQQIFDIVGEVVKKMFVADPNFLSFLTNPSEENLRKAFTTFYRTVTEHN